MSTVASYVRSIPSRRTVALPVTPSNVRKLAYGGSRPARAFSMSCARRPPSIAHVGENSYDAVSATVLKVTVTEYVINVLLNLDKNLRYTYSMTSFGILGKTCVLRPVVDISLFPMDSSSAPAVDPDDSSGSLSECRDWYSHRAFKPK